MLIDGVEKSKNCPLPANVLQAYNASLGIGDFVILDAITLHIPDSKITPNKYIIGFNNEPFNIAINVINNIINKGAKWPINLNISKGDDNAIYYLLDILAYLNYNPIKLEIIEYKNSNTINNINNTLSYIPDIIILKIKNIQTNDNSNEELHKKSVILNINIKNLSIKYRLDSIILRDTKEKHFCSLLTYNKNEYGFDGVSYRKLSKFNWKQMINKNKNWTFKGSNWRENNESIIWNFQNGYQLLFYYRI